MPAYRPSSVTHIYFCCGAGLPACSVDLPVDVSYSTNIPWLPRPDKPPSSQQAIAQAYLFEHVVEVRQGQLEIKLLRRLPVRVQPLAEIADAGGRGFVGDGEREGARAGKLRVKVETPPHVADN